MPFLFEKLDVYQKALNFSESISKTTDSFSRGNYYLIDQLNRAALSISINIAEGNGRWHANDKKQFFVIARGSSQECVPILELCKRKGLIDEPSHKNYKDDLDNIGKMLSGLIKKVSQTSKSS